MNRIAERRMFSKNVIDSDHFLDMPISARLLYYDLGMRADDDGFVNSPKKIMRMVGASEDDFRILEARKFIIPFETGIIVIRHWRINNYLRGDRYKPTIHLPEKEQLLVDGSGQYFLPKESGIPPGIPTVYPDKDSIDKNSKEYNNAHKTDQESIQKQISGMFERLWKAYPNKKGKAQVSDKKKRELFSIGEETIRKCLDRYVTEQNEKKQSGMFCPEWQHGSTFFNSGYVDYLDENYFTESEQSTEEIQRKPETEPINLMDVDDETFYKLKNGNAL